MARPTNEGQQATEKNPDQTKNRPTERRESYIAGEPDSAPELVRFMESKTEADIAAIPTNDLAIAATQAKQTISEWEVTIISYQEQLDDLSTQIEQLRTQNSEQQIVIRYLEQNRTVQMTPAPSSVKTTKIPDPDPLSDGKDPTFENWKIQRSRSRDPDRGQVHCEP